MNYKFGFYNNYIDDIMITLNKHSNFLRIGGSNGLMLCHTSHPQLGVDYDTNHMFGVSAKIIGVDMI